MSSPTTGRLPAVQPQLPPAITGRRIVYAGIVGHLVVGSLHLAVDPHHVGRVDQLIFEVVVLVGSPVAMLVFLRWFERSTPGKIEYWRLALWGIAGTTGAVAIGVAYLLNLYFAGIVVESLSAVILFAGAIGAPMGLFVGWQEVRVRRSVRRAKLAEARAELSEKHEESMAFLNRILRHHVLNGLNVILGAATQLSAEPIEDVERHLETIQVRSELMAEYVEDVRRVVSTLSGEEEPKRVDLSTVLERELTSARGLFPNARFEATISPGVAVVGSELTGVAFENLLENAVKHNDSERPAVSVDVVDLGPVVRVEIADDGPGIPDDRKHAYFRGGEHGRNSLGEGLGLYLAETIFSVTGGRIWIEDNEPRGTRVEVELAKWRPRSSAESASVG